MSDCHNHCSHPATNPSVYQTLDEMEFERGIWYAAQNNDLDRIKKLLQQGVSVNASDNAGYTALHYAVRAGHHDVCHYLIEVGASVNAVTKAGQATPLHRAASAGHEKIVNLLLKSGADVERADVDGKTALHRAVERGCIPVINLIINISPSLKTVKDNKDKLPIDYAGRHQEVHDLLQ